jgi:lipopolysaccharide heptosyltransferase I
MKILIVRLGALGDIVHAVPAFAALRRAYADAAIDWIVEERHREIVELIRGLRRRILIDTQRRRLGIVGVIRQLRRERYDIAIDLQGLLKSAVVARLSGAARVIGFDRPALREPAAALFYGERYVTDDRQHVLRKNLSLVAAVAERDRVSPGSAPASWGPPSGGPGFVEFPLDVPSSSAALDAYALLNPGAAWPNKRWPPDRFGAVAHWLHERHGLRSQVLWGPGERSLADAVSAASSGAAEPARPTRIADVLALARAARLVISGDTGPLHLAAAVGAPVIGLYGPTTPARNGPWMPDDLTVSRFEACDCHYERRCRRASRCIDDIKVEDVQQAVDERLARASRTVARR